jgi:hypothetical protein
MLFAGNVAIFQILTLQVHTNKQETSTFLLKNGDFNSYNQGANNMPYSLDGRELGAFE